MRAIPFLLLPLLFFSAPPSSLNVPRVLGALLTFFLKFPIPNHSLLNSLCHSPPYFGFLRRKPRRAGPCREPNEESIEKISKTNDEKEQQMRKIAPKIGQCKCAEGWITLPTAACCQEENRLEPHTALWTTEARFGLPILHWRKIRWSRGKVWRCVPVG